MSISVKIPELNMKEEEIKLLLAIKLFEEGIVSLGKASEIAEYSSDQLLADMQSADLKRR